MKGGRGEKQMSWSLEECSASIEASSDALAQLWNPRRRGGGGELEEGDGGDGKREGG